MVTALLIRNHGQHLRVEDLALTTHAHRRGPVLTDLVQGSRSLALSLGFSINKNRIRRRIFIFLHDYNDDRILH